MSSSFDPAGSGSSALARQTGHGTRDHPRLAAQAATTQQGRERLRSENRENARQERQDSVSRRRTPGQLTPGPSTLSTPQAIPRSYSIPSIASDASLPTVAEAVDPDGSRLRSFPHPRTFSNREDALRALKVWLCTVKERGGLSDWVLREYRDAMNDLISKYFRFRDQKRGYDQVWAVLVNQMTCKCCTEPLKRPMVLACGHIACEGCLAKTFVSQFKTKALSKLDSMPNDIPKHILRVFPITDNQRFQTFLWIFLWARGFHFVRHMMRYECPDCRCRVDARPQLCVPLDRVSAIIQPGVPQDPHMDTLFVDLRQYIN